MYASLFCLNSVSYGTWPTPLLCLLLVGKKWHLLQTVSLPWLWGNSCWARGTTHSLMKLILFCPFSVWGKCCSIQCLHDLCLSRGVYYPQAMQWVNILGLLLLARAARVTCLPQPHRSKMLSKPQEGRKEGKERKRDKKKKKKANCIINLLKISDKGSISKVTG